MPKIKYKVEFKNKNGNYATKDYEFNDEQHFTNWYNKQIRDESYRKIVGFDRVYEETKEHSRNDLHQAFIAGKGETFATFEAWFKFYFKQTPT